MSVFIGSTKVAGGPTVSQQLYSPDKYYNDGDSVIHNGNVWKRSGSGSGVEPGTDYNVWNVGFSNENLLDNPWFTVNQRGATTWSSGYGIDRWTFFNNGIFQATITDAGLTLSSANYEGRGLGQIMLTPTTGDITISVKVSQITGAFYLWVDKGMDDPWERKLVNSVGITAFHTATSGIKRLNFFLFPGTTCTIEAVKLELGPISTLANDTAPDYATELVKCQRYYENIPFSIITGVADTSTRVWRTNSISYKVLKRIFEVTAILLPNPVQEWSCLDLVTNELIPVNLDYPTAINNGMFCPAFTGNFVVGRQYQFILPDMAVAISADL